MGKIIRLTENDLNRIVRRVIQEQGAIFGGKPISTQIDSLLKSLGFVEGMENLRNLSPDIADKLMNPKSWVKPEEVYSMKSRNGFPVFLIKSGDVFYVAGKFPDMKYQRGIVYTSGQVMGFSLKDSRNREYSFSGIRGKDLNRQLLDGIYGPSYDNARKLPELLKVKGFITGMDLYRYPKAKEFLRSKGVTETRNFFISLEKETPIVVLQQIDEMNYRVIIDTYKIIVDGTPRTLSASEIYEKLS